MAESSAASGNQLISVIMAKIINNVIISISIMAIIIISMA
jgi:hypothetical protein